MAEHTELDDGLWLSVTELAEKKGVGKSTISEKVTRLVSEGRLTTKPGAGKQKLINLAQYDTAIGEVGDGAREQGAATKAADRADTTISPKLPDGRLRDEQTRDKAYAADLKFIDLERARGNLLAVADFDPLAEDAASRIGDIVDGLLARDSDLTAVAIKEGENGMRAALKRIARTQRVAIVTAMKDMAIAARARAASNASGVPMLQADLLSDDDPVQTNGV
jgi:DNA-binding GntR family transcriptional regulator